MQLTDLYRELQVPQYHDTWGSSGRNEAANTVVVQVDWMELREATASEKQNGIAIVHDSGDEDADNWWRPFMLDDIAFAHAQESCVRAIVVDRRKGGGAPESASGWHILPNLGRV